MTLGALWKALVGSWGKLGSRWFHWEPWGPAGRLATGTPGAEETRSGEANPSSGEAQNHHLSRNLSPFNSRLGTSS